MIHPGLCDLSSLTPKDSKSVSSNIYKLIPNESQAHLQVYHYTQYYD